jgi:predicted N-acetyltransferase YhbS
VLDYELATMNIRNTTEDDELAVWQVHEAAFGPEAGQTIAALAIGLLHDPTASPFVSLVACSGATPIGHVVFTSVRISGSEKSPTAHILAPLAVLPDHQRHGTGTQLVRTGLTLLAESGCELVFVLGHPEYYPRFGFQPAGRLGFTAPYPIPKDKANAWMVVELRQGAIGNTHGTVLCADTLDKLEHWLE